MALQWLDVVLSFHKIDFAPAKNFIKKKPPRLRPVPAPPARGVHAASVHARPPAWEISNVPAGSDVEAV
jgi:hypothetical protein